MFGLEFNHAALLGLLVLALPFAGAIWYASVRAAIFARRAYAEERFLSRLGPQLSLRSQVPVLMLWLAAVTLLVAAIAGPTLNMAPQNAKAGSMEVVIAWDASNSMGAEDYKNDIPDDIRAQYYGGHGNRLDMAKYVVERQIMPAIAGNKIAFETYKGTGFNQAPLTDDYQSLHWVLRNWVRIGQAPCCGSDYGRGLQGAIDVFKQSKNPNAQRVIVLFSDGGFTGDDKQMADVVKQLHDQHIRLVIFGLGMPGSTKVPQYDDSGKFTGYFQVGGKDAYTQIDEAPLRALAAETGGQYYHVDHSGVTGLNWPTTLAGRDKVEMVKTDVYKIPLTVSILMILVLAFFGFIQNPQETLASLKLARSRGISGNWEALKATVTGRDGHGRT